MIPGNGSRRAQPDDRDLEIALLKRQLAEARVREREVLDEERGRFSALSAASKRFAASVRTRADERQRQQRRLDAQYAVSRVLEESRDLAGAAPGVFRALGDRLGWEAGVLWTLDNDVLRCGGVWRSPGMKPDDGVSGAFEEACRQAVFHRGSGLPGRVWRREEPCWVENVLEDEWYERREEAARDGLRCALAFPIQDGGRLVGVFELLRTGPTEPEDDMLRTVYLIGHQMGQFVERRRAEAERDRALFRERESSREATNILESINDAFFAVDGGWKFTYVNRRAEEFWGRPRGELLGKQLWTEFPVAVGSEAARELHRAMERRETVGFETLSPVTGFWISARAYPSADGVSVYFRDITESKRAEQAVRRSEERYRTLANNIPGAVFRATVSGGQPSMEFISDRIEEITGYPAADFVSDRVRNYGDVVHPEDRPRNDRRVWRALELKEPYNIEYRVICANGETRWVSERGTGTFSEENDLLWVDGAIFDVTDRKESEKRLAESEARFRAAFEQARVGIVQVSLDGRILLPNAGFCNIVGYTEQEARGLRVGDITHPDDYEADMEHGRRVLAGDIPGYSMEKRYVRKDGSVVWVNLTSTLVRDGDGQPLYALAVVEDIDERKRAGEALRDSEEKYRTLFESMDEGFCIIEKVGGEGPPDFRYVEANPAVSAQSGVGDVVGKTIRQVVPAEAEEWVGIYDNLLKTGEPIRFERPLAATGRVLELYAFRMEDDKPGRVAVVFKDVTGRRQAEQTLRESEEMLRRVIDIETVGVLFFDTGGRITGSNDAFLAMSGYDRDDLERGLLRWDEMTPPEWMPRSRRAIAEIQAAGGSTPYEKEYIRKDGSRWWGLFAGKRLAENEGVEYVLDITGRRRAEEAVRENDEWLRIAQRAARAGTWEWDLVTGEIRWSREHRELFGFDPEGSVTREEWWAAVHPDDLPRIEETGRRCSEEGEEWPEVEYRILRDGRTRWIDARGRTMRDEQNRPVRILGISVDITERKEAEAERDRLLAQQWVADAEAAERERISRELHDRVAHSMGVAHQSLQLYDVLREKNPQRAAEKLDLARETTKAALEATRNLSAELRQLEAEEGLEAELRNLLDVVVPPHIRVDLSVRGDEENVPGHVRGQLFLIMREAVRNSVAHSGCSSLSVALEVGEGVIGRVEDDGRGLEATGGHAGVGLRSMKERAALLDGSLRLAGEPDGGTRVEIEIPLGGGR